MTSRVISELFLKDDTFAWVTVFSEFCLQPATAVNVFECPSTSFIDEKVVEQSIKISAVRLVLQHRLPQRLFYKATISDPHRNIFRHKWLVAFGGFSASLDGTVISGMWEPEDIGQSSANWKLFISCCFPTLLDWNTRELKSLLIIRAPPGLLLSGAPKLISRLWLWTFLISVLLTASFWKRNGSQGRLMKGQIFSADLLTKMTGPSTLLYFEWLTPMGPSHNRSVCVALQF